jgi:hypothetical protein
VTVTNHRKNNENTAHLYSTETAWNDRLYRSDEAVYTDLEWRITVLNRWKTAIGFRRLRHELSRFSPYMAPFRTIGMIDLGWLFLFHIYKSYMKRQTNKALTREKQSPYHPDNKPNRRMRRRNLILNCYIFLKLKNIKNYISCYVLIRYPKKILILLLKQSVRYQWNFPHDDALFNLIVY